MTSNSREVIEMLVGASSTSRTFSMDADLARSRLQALGHTGRAAEAAALVLAGMSRTRAAKQVGVDTAAVIRLLNRYTITTTCPCCGGATKAISLEAKPQ